MMRRLMCALAVVAVTCGAVSAPASADTLTWRIESRYPYRVQIAFYSESRGHLWPGGGKAYGLNDSQVHEITLRCRTGEKICFGAWVTGNFRKYWGVGYNNRNSCTGCCFVCGAGETRVQILQP